MDGPPSDAAVLPGRATAADVARHAGVSRSTVSRAFTPGRSVGEDARNRILAAARDLGYEPDGLAKALISGRSGIVGILMGEMANPIHAVLHQSIGLHLQQGGFIPISAQIGADTSTGQIVGMFRRYRAEAVILTSMHVSHDLIAACRKAGLNVLTLNRVVEDGTVPSICADVEDGGRQAAAHMLATGRRRIAVARGVAGSWTAEFRAAGHLDGLARKAASAHRVIEGGYGYADGVAAAQTIVEAGCDGVLCPNDLFAIGLMDTLRGRFDLRVPDDVSVIGFDDIPMADWDSYRLTTVRLPVGGLAERGAAAIRHGLGAAEPIAEWLPCRLVIRASA